jgi:hypothetical protein
MALELQPPHDGDLFFWQKASTNVLRLDARGLRHRVCRAARVASDQKHTAYAATPKRLDCPARIWADCVAESDNPDHSPAHGYRNGRLPRAFHLSQRGVGGLTPVVHTATNERGPADGDDTRLDMI